MINFPDAPTDQQIFNASNGVVYQWIAASSLWKALGVGQQSVIVSDTAPSNPYQGMLWWNSNLAQMFIYYNDGNSSQWVPTASSPAGYTGTGGGGDFCASYASAGAGITGSGSTIVFGTVVSGNAGGWYSTSTGRYTPPAGRYSMSAAVAGVWVASSNNTIYFSIRKNSVGSAQNVFFASVNGAVAGASATENFDANGTDYFDVFVWSAANSVTQIYNCSFTAVPVIAPPPVASPAPTWRQLSRQTPAGVATVDYTNVPGDINEIMVHYDLVPATDNVNLWFYMYDNLGVIDATSGHYAWAATINYSSNTNAASANLIASTSGIYGSAGAVLTYPPSGGAAGVAQGVAGEIRLFNIRNTTRYKNAIWHTSHIAQNAAYVITASGSVTRLVNGAVTGLRLAFGAGNVASGSFEVWGSP